VAGGEDGMARKGVGEGEGKEFGWGGELKREGKGMRRETGRRGKGNGKVGGIERGGGVVCRSLQQL
jgi:hypothetical protein